MVLLLIVEASELSQSSVVQVFASGVCREGKQNRVIKLQAVVTIPCVQWSGFQEDLS